MLISLFFQMNGVVMTENLAEQDGITSGKEMKMEKQRIAVSLNIDFHC